MDSSMRSFPHSAPAQSSALTTYMTMPESSRNAAYNRSKPSPVYIPSRQTYQTSQYNDGRMQRNAQDMSSTWSNVQAGRQHQFSSIPISPSDSGRAYYRTSGIHGSGLDSISTTAPPSPSSYDYYSPPSIGYIDTSMLSRKVKDSPDFMSMSIEPNEIFSPASFRLSGSMMNNYHHTLTPPSSHRSLTSSQPSSTHSTPFSSRSRYLVNVPSSGRSNDQSHSHRRFDNGDDFTSPDVTPPHLFNSPILCPVTNHPFNASLMELPSSPVRPSTMDLTHTLASPMVETEHGSSIPLYEQNQSVSSYSPYLSPQSLARSLRSTVLASLQDRTISARLGSNFDMNAPDHHELPSADDSPRTRGVKRDRDSNDADMSEGDNVSVNSEDVPLSKLVVASEQEVVTPPSVKATPARSRLRVRDSLVRSRTAPVDTSNTKASKCEHCKTLAVNPRYGTGRFCGSRCARTFSIKQRYEKMQAAKANALRAASKPARARRARVPKAVPQELLQEEEESDDNDEMEEDEHEDFEEEIDDYGYEPELQGSDEQDEDQVETDTDVDVTGKDEIRALTEDDEVDSEATMSV